MELATELKQYLALKKWKWRPAGDGKNVAIRVCPFCGKAKWKFYIHAQRTIYRCWTCDAAGNLYKLKRELGDLSGKVVSAATAGAAGGAKKGKPIPMEHVDRWHKKLLANEKALEYLDKRGIGDEAIRHFKLGMQPKSGINWLSIPHINDGVCHNVKFRSLPPADKRFRRVKGSASVLYHADSLADHQDVVVVEGELDTISMWQAGVHNVVGLTGGANTFLPEWYDQLADKDDVTLVLDADAVGQEGARDIARRLGFDRCRNVLLPLKDANDVLVQMGPAELKRCLQDAEQFEVHGVVSLSDVLLQCTTQVETGEQGIFTPWHDVNRVIGAEGWQPGDLVILSAKVKVGKTTWALQTLKHNAELGIPSLVYCLEMKPTRLVKKIVAAHRKKDSDDLQPIDFKLCRYYLRHLPLHFVEPEWGGGLKPDRVMDKIREAVKRYGIRLMMFDHLHFLCRSLQYLTAEVGNVVQQFKLIAEELGIVVILIAQPKKIQGERVIKYDDIKDSSAIPADADQIILLHRAPVPAGQAHGDESSEQEVLEPKTMVRVDAGRFVGGGETYLYYAGAEATYYDWENRPAKKF